jgi:hypothetical protein
MVVIGFLLTAFEIVVSPTAHQRQRLANAVPGDVAAVLALSPNNLSSAR